jgi:indolepyruvate ferredoxin oxidoreductase
MAASETYGIDALALAETKLGDEQYANVMLLGAAYQTGVVPLAAASIEQAIQLNGTAVKENIAAFRHGRAAVSSRSSDVPVAAEPMSLDALVADRTADLVAYQNAAYARGFTEVVDRVRAAETAATGTTDVTEAAARYLYKLMAYKDEYEVARLSVDPEFTEGIPEVFGKGATYSYRLHPPVLRSVGLRHKVSLGTWFRPAFHTLAAMRRVRGTPFDVFGRTEVRRTERALIGEYRALVDEVIGALTPSTHDLAVELLSLPDLVRGYEHIKMDNVATYRAKVDEGLARLRENA